MAGKNIAADQVCEDLRGICQSRIQVTKDNSKKSKKQESDSIRSVATSIVYSIEPRLKTKNFPDDFAKGVTLDLPLVFDRGSLKEIAIGKLLDSHEVEIRAKGSSAVYSGTHPRTVAEAIVRAILLGRSAFAVSTDRKAMDAALNDFLEWSSEAEQDIDTSDKGIGFRRAATSLTHSNRGLSSQTRPATVSCWRMASCVTAITVSLFASCEQCQLGLASERRFLRQL